MPRPELTLAIIDDDEAVRDGLSALFQAEGYPVAAYPSAVDFLDAGGDAVPGCIIADINMPRMSGLELQAELARRGCALPIIILTGQGDVPKAVTALKAGAVDFIEKPFAIDALVRAVETAMDRSGDTLRHLAESQAAQSRLDTLSIREREVMDLLVAGHPNKVIAWKLGISARTVENHRARVMEKTGCDNVSALIHLALAAG
ncbi:response regulator transcription factor [Nitrospirillum iridis]|uniref:Two-component system response regulator DctR/two-component system response regulator FixJ n=1 Tax=Nitrospirillum iridis TaxID=765888 RepID=A0A7X0B0K4_9PROT|nr:response regulator [Nitrospirillum iridis]MBB6253563.1 two-component system response regulator DctR/two-component system response regulator FixJ [Nitrospirillum iridis]